MKKLIKFRNFTLIIVLVMILTLCTPIFSTALADDNGTLKEIVILSINDFHGSLKEEGKNIGMAKLVGLINEYRAKNANTIVVSAGDNYQGSALSNLTYGKPVSAMLKDMGIIASAVGNHEFDWGITRTVEWAEEGGFPFLSANIVDKETQEPVAWAKPYIVTEVNGVKIGFVGLTTVETSYKASYDQVKDYDFLPIKETAEKWAKYLKSGEAPEGKVDVVVALSHVGCNQNSETNEISGEVVDQELYKAEGIDAIIAGHSHNTVAGYVENMPVVQGYKNGRGLSILTLVLDKDNKVTEIKPNIDLTYKHENITEDANAKAQYDKFMLDLSPIMDEVVGSTLIDLPHNRSYKGTTMLGYFISDIIRKNVDAQIGLMNSGGIRCSIDKGNITMGKLYEAMPFDNTVVKIELTGEQLKKNIENGIDNQSIGWVEVAGIKVVYDINKEFGNRVVSMALEDGTKIEDDKYYTVATNDFMATNGDGYDFTNVLSNNDTCVPIRDIVADYLKEKGAIEFSFVQPLVQVDTEETSENYEQIEENETVNEKEPEYIEYIVVYGDCLWRIAQKYKTTYMKIATDNNIANPNLIFVNQLLRIYLTK